MDPSHTHVTRPAQLQVASIVIILSTCITKSLMYTRYVPAMVHHVIFSPGVLTISTDTYIHVQ